jgi:beta-fructofuranosidase
MSRPTVGFFTAEKPSREQQLAGEWLRERSRVDSVDLGLLGRGQPPRKDEGAEQPSVDIHWWHRSEPLTDDIPLGGIATKLDECLESGGDILLTGTAMAAVAELSVESVPPAVVGPEPIAEPTGLLWRSAYDDHPIPSEFESLRIALCADGDRYSARYEKQLPEQGEILASTVRGDEDCPRQMSAVSWQGEDGTVLGVGSGIAFDGVSPDWLLENQDRTLSAAFTALDGGYDHPGRPLEATELATMRTERVADHNRPGYHITPPGNWLNDPNGLVEWEDQYHVFYQYNPGGPFHNSIHWGHVVSDDLVTWRDEPVALTPSPDGPDRDGCWSGCTVDDDGTARIVYTGGRGREQLPCLAAADSDSLRQWTKYEGNPIIPEVPPELDITETEHWAAEFRDHCIWQEGDTWYQLIGSGIQDRGGAVLLYTAETLYDWEYEGLFLIEDEPSSDAIWECPELLDLGEKQLLHVSNYEDVVYFIGEMQHGEFVVDHEGVLDHGAFYAPQSMDLGKRSVTVGWLPEARDGSAQWDAGWSGALSLPRELSLGVDGQLRQQPAAEVTELRSSKLSVPESVRVDSDTHRFEAAGTQLELQFRLELEDAAACELAVLESPDESERTLIRYTQDGELVVDRSSASHDERTDTEAQRLELPHTEDGISIHAFVDHSVIELFVNEQECLTSRVYPTDSESAGLSFISHEGEASLRSFSAWKLKEGF